MGRLQGLSRESGAGRQFAFIEAMMPRNHDQLAWGPSATDDSGQPSTIHGSWHVHVRDDRDDVGTPLQPLQRFVGIRCLDDLVSHVRKLVRQIHSNQRFILDDQD